MLESPLLFVWEAVLPSTAYRNLLFLFSKCCRESFNVKELSGKPNHVKIVLHNFFYMCMRTCINTAPGFMEHRLKLTIKQHNNHGGTGLACSVGICPILVCSKNIFQ